MEMMSLAPHNKFCEIFPASLEIDLFSNSDDAKLL